MPNEPRPHEIHWHEWGRRIDARGHIVYACPCGAAVDWDAAREAWEAARREREVVA